jgi:chorismate-pyruvate lyase
MPLHLNRIPYSNHTQDNSLLRLLLTHDGSTTRLCSAINDAAVTVYVHQQHVIADTDSNPIVPELQSILGGTRWLQRITSLHNQIGDVFMDNLSFTRLDTVPDWFLNALEEETVPIGRLLDQLFIQRKPIDTSLEMQHLLWNTVGVLDPRASRSYKIATPEHHFMLIFEVFRDAVRVKIK